MKGKSKSKTNGTPKKKGEKKKNPWSDSDASDVEGATRALYFLKIIIIIILIIIIIIMIIIIFYTS